MARAKRTDGDGTKILTHPTGHRYMQVSLGNGKRKNISGKTDKEIIRKANELKAKVQAGLIAEPSKVTFGTCLERWLAGKKPEISPRSHELYKYTIELYVPQTLKGKRVQDLKRSHIKALLRDLAVAGLSHSTRSKVLQHVRAALNEALEDELVAVNVAHGLKIGKSVAEKHQDACAKALTFAEVKAFLDACADDAMYPLFYFLFSTGARRGEALGVRWRDIDFESGTVTFAQQVKTLEGRAEVGPLKTTKSRRTISVELDLFEVLGQRKNTQDRHRRILGEAWPATDLVFTTAQGTPIHPRNVNRSMKRIAKKAGIRHISSHVGRHTNISHRLKDGEKLEVVSAIAGHARPSITHDLYRTVFDDELRASVFSLADKLVAVREAERGTERGARVTN